MSSGWRGRYTPLSRRTSCRSCSIFAASARLGSEIERLIEGATGLGVADDIRSAYMFIAQNYVPDDEVFLFGFSRGAYATRSLAGLVNACGILKR